MAVLGAVQREVGRRWQTKVWSVADEHAATAIIDVALAAAAREISPPVPVLGAVVVTCAEEEWHVLPARMLAEQLRARGWEAVFLGASTPAEHLAAYLSRHRPVAVAVSCSIPIYLPGARRSIAASHAAGVPALAGGAGFGNSARRAGALGADGWAAGVDEAHAVFLRWRDSPPPLAAPGDDRGQLLLTVDRADFVEAAMTTLAAHFPPLATFSAWQRAKTREDLDYMLRFVEAALLTGDDNIIVDFTEWLVQLLASRGLPTGIVGLSARSLLACIPSDQPATRRLLELAAATDDAIAARAH